MKIRHRILYYLTVLAIVLVAGYGFFKRVIVSQKIRTVIIERLKPQLKADEFDISSLDMKTDKIYVNNILYKKDNLSVKIASIEIDYSLMKLLTKGINFKEWVDNIRINSVQFEIDRSYETSSKLNWDFDIEQYRSILTPLKNYSYLDTIEVNNFNFCLNSQNSNAIRVFDNLSGGLIFDKKGGLDVVLDGKLLRSKEKNVFLKGKLNYTSLNSEFNLKVDRSEIPKLRGLFGEYETDFGFYQGKLNLEINKYGNNQIFLFGDFRLNDFAGDILDKMRLSNINLLLSYYNGSLFFNEFNGYVDKIPFEVEGMLYNVLNPQGDIYLSFKDIDDRDIKGSISKFINDPSFLYQFNFFSQNSLMLHMNFQNSKISTNIDILSPRFSIRNKVLENIKLSGFYNKDRISISKCSFLTNANAVNFTGNYYISGSKKKSYNLSFSSTGSIFTEISFFKTTKIKKVPTILKGKIKGRSMDDYSMTARLEAFDFEKDENDILFYSSFDIEDEILMFEIHNSEDIQLGEGFYNLNSREYRFEGKDLLKPIKLLYGKTFIDEKELISFDLDGDDQIVNIHTNSEEPTSLLYGELDAKFKIDSESAESFVNWAPNHNNTYSKPANFRLAFTKKNIKISDIYLDYKPIIGEAWLDLKTEKIGGKLEAKELEFGSILGIRKFSSNTDMNIDISGHSHSPYIDLILRENEFMYFPGEGFESINLTGEAEIHLEGKKIRVEKILIYDDNNNKICTFSGNIKNFNEYSLNTYGELDLNFLSVLVGKDVLKGKLKYKLDSEGTKDSPRLNKCIFDLKDSEFNGDAIDRMKMVLTGSSDRGFYLELFQLELNKYLNLSAAGFVPYDQDDEMKLTGYFHGDILGYLEHKLELIETGYSENEGSFIIGGNIFKPKIDDLEIYFYDGYMNFKDVTGKLDNIRAKLVVKDEKKFDITQLSLKCAETGNKVLVGNVHGDKKYSDIIVPGGFDVGHFTLKFPDGGVLGRVPGIMQKDSYGTIQLSGMDSDKFRVAKSPSGISLIGRVELRNSNIAFPGNKSLPKRKSNKPNIFMETVSLDLDIIPSSGNTYYYNSSTSETSFWDKIKSSFTKFDNELSNVKLPVVGSNVGLRLIGALSDPKKLELIGEVNGRNGSCNYSAFSFKIDDATVTFSEARNKDGIMDPYIKAIGKTVVKTKLDSTGYSGYENIYIKIVTKEDDEIIDSEGGRISSFAVILLDENGNPWLEDDKKITDIDTQGTAREMFNVALDTRILSPFINPIETAIGKLLGAQVSIRPNITSNITQERPGGSFIPDSYGGYFVGSEFYISKFFTDNLALTLHSQYIGSDEYTEVVEQTYGYKNNLGFDYRLTNHILTSAGYQYDTLNETSGYNIGLSFRYRFKNISQPVNYLKRWWYKLK
ncbi:MAG: hypothetical protein GQ534_00725 [Candidatus Delongbacteria bacterium]|nr:hypothetical protein [Candidatus Delongbacteria bacterium]